MKDLYRLANLSPFESDVLEIKRKILQRPRRWEDVEHVLLHPGRKKIYDRTHANLNMIGLIRNDLNLGVKGFWAEQDLSDFSLKRKRTNKYSTTKNKSQPRATKKPSSFKSPLTSRAIFNTIVIIGVAIFLYYIAIEPMQRHGIPTVDIKNSRGNTNNYSVPNSLDMHVTAESLNVRSGPNNTSQVLGKLGKFHTVTVFPENKQGSWYSIKYNGTAAYVHEKYLKRGSGKFARLQECRKIGVSRPKHGTIWSRAKRGGSHAVKIVSETGPDALVKLKNRKGNTLYMAYVHGGMTVTIDDLPGGIYYFQYATGRNFGKACERFLDDMQASQDPKPIHFLNYQPAIMTYKLYRVKDGNFRPQSVSNEDF